jgi:NADH-quinone oxidoreductase subunit I
MKKAKRKKPLINTFITLACAHFCNLCIRACPSDCNSNGSNFEHAVWDRSELTKVLNQPGSKLMEGVKE